MKLYTWALALLFAAAFIAALITHLAIYQQTDFFQQQFYLLLVADGVLIVLLFIVLSWKIGQLVLSWRRGDRGARLSLRLSLLFWGVSLLPAVLLYSVSVSAVFRGIESWFDLPLGQSFERGISFGQSVVGKEFERLEYITRDIGRNLPRDDLSRLSFYINDIQLVHRLDSVALYDAFGRLLLSSEGYSEKPLSAQQAKQIITDGLYLSLLDSDINSVIDSKVQVSVPISYNDTNIIISAVRALPADIAEGLVEIERGRQQYEKLEILRRGLRWSFILTMTLALALILFSLGLLSVRLGRNLTRPLVKLSEAAEAVGKGDFNQQLSTDVRLSEIAHLNRSFNAMSSDLDQSRRQIAERQEALHTTNAYLENLLSSLTTGVLTFNSEHNFSGYNAAAAQFFNQPLEPFLDHSELPPSVLSTALANVSLALSEDGEASTERRVAIPGGTVLLVRASLLPQEAGGGMLIMIDDITRQMRAEREATLEEVSRSFVHEIKNPLTPIQLAAERLEMKLGSRLMNEDKAILHRLVESIVNQVDDIKQIANSFRDTVDKRLAEEFGSPQQLNDILRQVVYFYENRQVTLNLNLQEDLPQVSGNPVTLRQLLHNVLTNAMDAVQNQAAPVINISSREKDNWVEVRIEDNGGGVGADMLDKLHEPYVTGKPHGTGLGLAVVRKTVDEHRGILDIHNGAHGLVVSVCLPKE